MPWQVADVRERQPRGPVEVGKFCCPVLLACPLGEAEDYLVGVGVGWEIFDHYAAVVVADAEAGLQPQDGWVSGCQGG